MTIVKFPARFDFQKMLGAQRLTAAVPAGPYGNRPTGIFVGL